MRGVEIIQTLTKWERGSKTKRLFLGSNDTAKHY